MRLSTGEYWELTVEQRVALLKCLTGLALSAEPVRDLFQAQAETLQLHLGKGKVIARAVLEPDYISSVRQF